MTELKKSNKNLPDNRKNSKLSKGTKKSMLSAKEIE